MSFSDKAHGPGEERSLISYHLMCACVTKWLKSIDVEVDYCAEDC